MRRRSILGDNTEDVSAGISSSKRNRFAKNRRSKREARLRSNRKSDKKSGGLLKFTILIIVVSISAAFIIYNIYSAGSSTDDLLYKYTHLSERVVKDSKNQFDKKLHFIKVNEDGTKEINIGFSSDIVKQEVEEEINNATGGANSTGGNVNIVPAGEDIVLNEWLVLHAEPSVTGDLLTSHLDVGFYNEDKWSMGEGETVKPTKYCRQYYEKSDIEATRPTVNGVQQSIGYVTHDGRYYVAIGPGWFNSVAVSNGITSSITPSLVMNGVEKFDIVVNYGGKTYYIYAALGDAKAHTFINNTGTEPYNGKGIIQTGFKWDGTGGNKWFDFSCVEWCGVKGSIGSALSTELEFVGLKK